MNDPWTWKTGWGITVEVGVAAELGGRGQREKLGITVTE